MTDQRKEQGGSFSIQTANGEGVNLGSYPEVLAIVQRFATAVTENWNAYTDGKRTQTESMADLTALAVEYAAIWNGTRPGYSLPPWRNTATRKGKSRRSPYGQKVWLCQSFWRGSGGT